MKRALGLIFLLALPCMANYDKDLDLPISPWDPPAPVTTLGKSPPKTPLEAPAPIIAHDPPPPPELPPSIYGKDLESKSASVLYIIDISGSMGLDAGPFPDLDGVFKPGNRLDHAKVELIRSVTSLPKNFEFNVESYDCVMSLWAQELVKATPENKESAKIWINALQPGGATGTGPAGEFGLLMFPKNKLVVLLTDGDPNCGAGDEFNPVACRQAHLSRIRVANVQNARIDVFGVWATGDFRRFCMELAGQNNGSYMDVF